MTPCSTCGTCAERTAMEAVETHEEIDNSPIETVYKKHGFVIYQDVLSHEKYLKHPATYLRNLFNARNFECLAEKNKWVILSGEMSIPFYVAQLVLHAVSAARGMTYGQLNAIHSKDLAKMLQDAVDKGECDQPSEVRTEIEKQMFADYKIMKDRWKAKYKKWLARKTRADGANRWPLATTPEQLADRDPKQMVKRYFCNRVDNKLSRADQTITPDPLLLVNFQGNLKRLEKAQRRVPGLKHVVVTTWADNVERKVHGLGWDLERVTEAVHATAKDAQETFWEEQWAQVLADDGHDAFVAQALENNQRFPNMAGRCAELANLKGVFAMCVPGIREEHRRYNVLYLQVSHLKDTIALAACDFGIIKGTMMLCTDATLLQEFHDVDEGDITMSSPVRRHHPHPPGASSSPLKRAVKRRRVVEEAINPRTSLCVNRDGEYPIAFMFRGRDTSNDQIDHEPRRGTLYFSDADLHSFRGSVEFGLPYETLTFKGYRVDGVPEPAPRWDTFSSEAYEKEERARLEDAMEE